MNPTKTAINLVLMLLLIGAGVALFGPAASPPGGDAPLLDQFDICQETWNEACGGSPPASDIRKVTQNLTLTGRHYGAIRIDADTVMLDCAGHAVVGAGRTGIDLTDRAGVTVENCEVWGFDVGVRLDNTIDATVKGNTASANDVGFSVAGSSGNRLEDNRALLNSVGFRLEASHSNRLHGNVTNQGLAGFEILSGEDNDLQGNEATDARGGIVVNGSRNVVADNVLTQAGLWVRGSDNTISGNQASGGIRVQGTLNTLDGNRLTGDGFQISGSNNTLTENVVTGDQTNAAFSLSRGTGNVFSENRATDVDFGFFIGSSRGNSFVGNSVTAITGGLGGRAVTLFNTFTDNIGLDMGSTLVVTEDLTLDHDHEGRIVIDAPGVTLDCDGHAIWPAGGDESAASHAVIGIEVDGHDDVTVENCDTGGYRVGIVLLKSSGTSLIDNDAAIWLRHSRANTVTGNTGTLISLGAGSNRNTVAENMVGSITLKGSNRNTVTGNSLRGGPLSLAKSNHNSVVDNAVDGGEGITMSSASDNTIAGNTVRGASVGFTIRKQSNNNTLESNVVSGSDIGFVIATTSQGNNLTANKVASTRVGFKIRNAHNNILRANDVTDTSVGLETTENKRTFGNELIDNIGM